MKRGKPIEQLDDDRSLQIGRVVVRYSLLENIMDSTVRDLLQVTHKEGRLAVKTGSILDRLDLIEDLLGLYGTTTSVDIDKLRERLTTIAQHRNTIVHGAWFLTDKDEVRVRYTRGRWEKEPRAKKGIKRIIRPAGNSVHCRGWKGAKQLHWRHTTDHPRVGLGGSRIASECAPKATRKGRLSQVIASNESRRILLSRIH